MPAEKTYFLNSHIKEQDECGEMECYYPIHRESYKYPVLMHNASLELSAWMRGDNVTEDMLLRTSH